MGNRIVYPTNPGELRNYLEKEINCRSRIELKRDGADKLYQKAKTSGNLDLIRKKEKTLEEKVEEESESAKDEPKQRIRRTVSIPEEFFERYPNVPYNVAVEILADEYGITDITKAAYHCRRERLKGIMPEIKNLKRGHSEHKLIKIVKDETLHKKAKKMRRWNLRERDTSLMDSFKRKDWIPNPKTLAKAIMNAMAKTGYNISDNEAKESADHVLNFFGYDLRIVDNVLESKDRDVFYMLEDIGIVKTENDEITLYDGRIWRLNYWLLYPDFILSLVEEDNHDKMLVEKKEETKCETIYSDLPEDVWKKG